MAQPGDASCVPRAQKQLRLEHMDSDCDNGATFVGVGAYCGALGTVPVKIFPDYDPALERPTTQPSVSMLPDDVHKDPSLTTL